MKLLECVPNFSEGRDSDAIEQIVSAVRSCKVLDLHSDPDHNRTVVTFIGEPQKAIQAAFELCDRAVQVLDVNSHKGVHPFVGVVDVIPFVPFKNCSMKDAREAAWKLGKMLWSKLKLPVFYYGEAAKVPDRKELPYVRRGGFQALKVGIDTKERRPDEGHGLHHLAGAVSVGARDYLIAFNVFLSTDNLNIAKSIAKNIREKSGGLKGVRALGVELKSKGITQVSINLVDLKETSLPKVFEQVEMWAKEYEVEILGSELVGLLPQEAYFEGLEEQIRLPAPVKNKIIENNYEPGNR